EPGRRAHPQGITTPAGPGPGCKRCRNTGYLDRVAIVEVLVPNEALRIAISSGATAGEIRSTMRSTGCPLMRQNGLRLVAEGVTSIEKLDRRLAARDRAREA